MAKRKVRAATIHARAKKAGISALGGYSAQLSRQDSRCAICGRPPKVRRLNIDHNHQGATMEVRGLLCHKCNRMLAWAGDNPDTLSGAALYLRWGWSAAKTYREALWAIKGG